MKKDYHCSAKLRLCLYILLSMVSNNCLGQHLKNLDYLSNLKFNQGRVQVTASYSILENTKCTPSLDTFDFGHYVIKAINKENPEKLILEVTKTTKPPVLNKKPENIKERLPWWSKSAPEGLKSLDFSKVDGKLEQYKIGEAYQLKLLEKQGHWGKVYVLEHLVKGSKPKKICAVKLLLTRQDRKMNANIFHQRHIDEIKNNFIVSEYNLDISIKPFGMLKNDEDHYLVFLEYGRNAHDIFQKQSIELSTEALYDFMLKVNKLHSAGYAHGDLKIDNMLFVNNKIKLCDWYSLNVFNEIDLKEYRYIGDNLPPEAMRALYFGGKGGLLYSIVTRVVA